MALKILNRIVNGVKGGIKEALKGTSDIGSTVINVTKNLAVNTIKESGE